MARTIRLDADAYGLLRAHQRPSESLSDVVRRLATPGPFLSGLSHMRTDADRARHLQLIAEIDKLDQPPRPPTPSP